MTAPDAYRQPSPSEALQAIRAELRDIHQGPALEPAQDPRLMALGGLLIAAIAACLIAMTALTLLRQRRWAHRIDWQADDLVPRLQDALREAAMARWPEAAPLQGEAWLAWLDSKGGAIFPGLPPSGRSGSMGAECPMRRSAKDCASPISPGGDAASARRDSLQASEGPLPQRVRDDPRLALVFPRPRPAAAGALRPASHEGAQGRKPARSRRFSPAPAPGGAALVAHDDLLVCPGTGPVPPPVAGAPDHSLPEQPGPHPGGGSLRQHAHSGHAG